MSIDFDHAYLNRVLDGDKNAFRYFINEYQEMGYSIAISMVKSHQDAEDVVQEAFVRAYRNLRSFKKESKFSSWFYRIVVNESLRVLKKKKKQHVFVEINEDRVDIEFDFNDAVKQIDLSEKKEAIQKTLLGMKPKEALILKMYYLNELSLKEMVNSTGWTENNIKVLLYRARKSFMCIYIKVKG